MPGPDLPQILEGGLLEPWLVPSRFAGDSHPLTECNKPQHCGESGTDSPIFLPAVASVPVEMEEEKYCGKTKVFDSNSAWHRMTPAISVGYER